MNDTQPGELTHITCGCGDHAVDVSDYDHIQELDVLCPVCDRHYGFARGKQ